MQDRKKPLVSICCITYNHEPYIRDCLEGFVMQKTNFPFEVLIHDDASTDHTAEIIREYEAKYPDIVKPIYQTENQYSQGINVLAFIINCAQGKYIALCEGDDFWSAPDKLQRQVDFMERNPDFAVCFHDVNIVDDHGRILDGYNKAWGNLTKRSIFTMTDLLRCGNLMNTPSVFYRKPAQMYACKGFTIDFFTHLQISYLGKIKRIDGIMASYRIHSGGIFQTCQTGSLGTRIRICRQQIAAWRQFCRLHSLSRKDFYWAQRRLLDECDRLRSFLMHGGYRERARRIARFEMAALGKFLFRTPVRFFLVSKTIFIG